MSKIRIQRLRDPKLMHQLNEQMFGEDYYEEFEAQYCWLATTPTGDIAGFASLQIVDDGDAAYLSRCGVFREYRGKGLQKRLIQVRERLARKLGVRSLITYTASWNMASANSLISQGYKLYAPAHVWGLERDKALYFYKKVNR